MIVAGITLFNPNLEVLEKNIAAIINQVDGVVCVDNGSNNWKEIEDKVLVKFPNLAVVKNEKNMGIATALNQMFEYAKKVNGDWVLTLDQDSICPNNIIEEFKKHLDISQIGSICPIISDRNYESKDLVKYEEETTYIERCITSASLTPVSVWENVGGFLDELFIDFVDHDFCAKLIEKGYKILRVNNVILDHEMGEGKAVSFLGFKITVLNHSEFRKYHMARNWIYYIKAHKNVINCMEERVKFIFFFVKTLLYEENKLAKLKVMIKGVKDSKDLCKNVIR